MNKINEEDGYMTDKYEANIKLISETIINKLIKYFLKNLNIVTKKLEKLYKTVLQQLMTMCVKKVLIMHHTECILVLKNKKKIR